MTTGLPEWLDGYASRIYDWQTRRSEGRTAYTRRIGIVEGGFDVDGTDFEGRADLNVDMHLELRTSLDEPATREHIILAWSVLRQQHALLSAKAVTRNHVDSLSGKDGDRAFVFEQAANADELLSWGREHIDFMADSYPQVDPADFYKHLMNASRVIDSLKALARLFVLPFRHSAQAPFAVNFMLVPGHQITDGLTIFRWASSFIDLLNLSTTELEARATDLCSTPALDRLPPAQEALYPPIHGNIARQRWFWAISRILRHTKITNPPAFQNPLLRPGSPIPAVGLPSTYSKLLTYTHIPPINSYAIQPTLSPRATRRLKTLCRDARISFGAGLFTLVGMVMMLLEERLHPSVPDSQRLPYIGSFPLNPRPWLAGTPTTGKEDSLMLAFSDGLVLPFLPSSLPFTGRFRLLGKQAHRQLKQYQKRKPVPSSGMSSSAANAAAAEAELRALGTKSPTQQLLPLLYMSTLERLERGRSQRAKKGWDLQHLYPAAEPKSRSTCGVSSVGDRTAMVRAGKYDTSSAPEVGKVVADFRDMQSCVRAREGEFLCGAVSDGEKTYFMISVDGCAIDMAKATEFKNVMEHILEEEPEGQEGLQTSSSPRSRL